MTGRSAPSGPAFIPAPPVAATVTVAGFGGPPQAASSAAAAVVARNARRFSLGSSMAQSSSVS